MSPENTTPQLRRLTGDDLSPPLLKSLGAIEEAAFGPDIGWRWVIPVIARQGILLVSFLADEPAALAQAIRSWEEPGRVYLHSLVVAEPYRRRGLAGRLLNELITVCQSGGAVSLDLTVDPNRIELVEFYRRLGFQIEAELSKEYGPGHDRLYMSLNLL